MDPITLNSFFATSSSFDTTSLMWTLNPTREGLTQYQIIIYRGDNNVTLSGIDIISSSDFSYSDPYVGSFRYNKLQTVYYQISFKNINNPSLEYFSPITGINQSTANKATLEINRRNNIVFKNVLKNSFYLLKLKTTGTYCSCYDVTLNEKVIPGDHLECYNTTWVGGYFNPVIIYGNLGSANINQRATPNGLQTTQPTQFVTSMFPALSMNDVIVDRMGNRWLTGALVNPQNRLDTYKQVANVQLLDRSSLVYKFPLNLLNLS